MRSRTARNLAAAAIALVVIAVTVAWFRARGAVPADARQVVDRFVEALGTGRLDDVYACADAEFRAQAPAASLAPVLRAMDSVLGRRLSTAKPSVTRRDEGGSRLSIEIPSAHERGTSVLDLVAARGADGRWSVSRCAARSAAFEWVLR